MKWFKHQSNSRNDEKIAILESRSGLEGYGFYFKLLEVVAESMDQSRKCSLNYSLAKWSNTLNIHHNKFTKLLGNCEVTGLVTVKYHRSNLWGKDEVSIEVIIPMLLKYRDNHTKNLQVTCSQDIEIEIEKEIDINTTKLPAKSRVKKVFAYTDEFEEFWKIYPRGENKKKSFDAWLKVKPDVDLQKIILDAVAAKKTDPSWMADGGKWIPHPTTYINDRRWEDEVGSVSTVVEFVQHRRYFN